MSHIFRNRKTPRAKWWDYTNPAAYFVTICTQNREHLFGEIANGELQYSPSGIIASIMWQEIKNHFPTVDLDEFVIMPNHVHGIIIIRPETDEHLETDETFVGTDDGFVRTDNGFVGAGDGFVGTDNGFVGTDNGFVGTGDGFVGTGHALSLQNAQNATKNKNQNHNPPSLSTIVGSYKSAVTKYCNRFNLPAGWQSRFHDVIIKDQHSFERIQQYIINNPANWSKDDFNDK